MISRFAVNTTARICCMPCACSSAAKAPAAAAFLSFGTNCRHGGPVVGATLGLSSRQSSSFLRKLARIQDHQTSSQTTEKPTTKKPRATSDGRNRRSRPPGRRKRDRNRDGKGRNRSVASTSNFSTPSSVSPPPSRFRSSRLIEESAAVEAVDRFLHAQRRSKKNNRKWSSQNAPWKDTTLLLSAEQALEFFANRNNDDASHSRRKEANKDADVALQLFTALHYFHSLEEEANVLNNAMYSHVIDACSKSSDSDHVSYADVLFRQFVALYIDQLANGGGDRDEVPLCDVFRPEKEFRQQRRELLTRPGTILWVEKDRHHYPNVIRATAVMRGHARHKQPVEAESLLDLLILLSAKGHQGKFRPNERSYATVIDAYSRCSDGPNAQRILEMMKRRSFRTGVPLKASELPSDIKMINAANIVAYNATIAAWARTAKNRGSEANFRSKPSSEDIMRSREAAEKAEELLREMWSENTNRSLHLPDRKNPMPRNVILPDVVTYSSVISAYASSWDQPHGMNRARKLLSELEGCAALDFSEYGTSDLEEDGSKSTRGRGFQPSTTTYNSVLNAFAQAGDAGSAEDIFDSMQSFHRNSMESGGGPYQHVKPDSRTYNTLMNAYAIKGGAEAGAKALDVLNRMENSSGVKPNPITYSTAIKALARSASVDPSSQSDSNGDVLVGECAAYRALNLLKTFENRYILSKTDDEKANGNNLVIPYNSTITAFANAAQHSSSNASSLAEEAESILKRMKAVEGIKPDAISHNAAMLAWARTGGQPAALRAELILRSMKNPTTVSLSTVLNAWAQADSAPKAAALLSEMEKKARFATTPTRIVPNTVLYNNVLNAWCKSSEPDALENAEALLSRMESDPTCKRPDPVSYLTVLNALSKRYVPDRAQRAKAVLDKLLAKHSTELASNHRDGLNALNAYNYVLAACAHTPPDASDEDRTSAADILVDTFRQMNHQSQFGGPDQESYTLFLRGCSNLFEDGSEDRRLLIESTFRVCGQRGLVNEEIEMLANNG